MYYHVFLNKTCHDRLQEQIKKLHALSVTLETWRDSEYGNLIRFCDKGTLTRVAKVWEFYISAAAAERQDWLKEEFQAAVKMHNRLPRDKAVVAFDGLRSAAPAGIVAGTSLNDIHRHFWEHGSLDMDSIARDQATYTNPMMFSPNPGARLHSGTNPVLGFHLAPAYMPSDPSSSLHRAPWSEPKLEDVVAAAKGQFSAWSKAFRGAARRGNLTLRCFVGGAQPLCYTLQHRHKTGGLARTAHWYRDQHNTMDPLILVDDDYGPCGTAPTSFHVIDAFGLVDGSGTISMIMATSPLLDGKADSTLYATSLAPHSRDSREPLEQDFGSHLATVSLLLGLFPIEYWTNTSSSCIADGEVYRRNRGPGSLSQQPPRLKVAWKRPPCDAASRMACLHIAQGDLVSGLLRICVEMFSGRALLQPCTRVGIAALLSLVKTRVVTDWDGAMRAFLGHIESNASLSNQGRHVLEIYLHMHLLGVHMVPFPDFSLLPTIRPEQQDGPGGLLGWQGMPLSVCVTLKVPRSALAIFTNQDEKSVRRIPVHVLIQNEYKSLFTALQLGFGTLATAGTRRSSSFQLIIEDDAQAWHGSCPLFVSFRVPSWTLFFSPPNAMASLRIDINPTTSANFADALGANLTVFEMTIRDTDHVFVSKEFPNQHGRMRVPGFAKDQLASPQPKKNGATTTLRATFNTTTGSITGTVAHLDLVSDSLRSDLRNGKQVQVTPPAPCEFLVAIGESVLPVTFPHPVLPNTKTLVARKSGYISITGVVMKPSIHPSASFTAPLLLPAPQPNELPIPVCWTTPYTTFAALDVISTTNPDALSFLKLHLGNMVSRREFYICRTPSLHASTCGPEEVRINLKQGLSTMFYDFIGLNDDHPKLNAFILSSIDRSVRVMLLASSLRFDGARRTVLLDCAVLEMTAAVKAMFEESGFKGRLAASTNGGVSECFLEDDQLLVWRKVLPAWVERCRGGAWTHRRGCEYYQRRQVPGGLEMGEEVLCRCGRGVFPPGWEVEGLSVWEELKGLCSRAAIAPVFASPLVEDVTLDIGEMVAFEAANGARTACHGCGRTQSKEGGELKSCSQCLKVKYCGRACQRAEWKRHKKECSESANQKTG